jgi:hypothetical protein
MKTIKAWGIQIIGSDEILGCGVAVPGYYPDLHDKTVFAIGDDLKKLKQLKKCADEFNHGSAKIVIVPVEIRIVPHTKSKKK